MKYRGSAEGVATREGVRFWETTPLEELTPEQWESLCGRCGQCCLHKVEDVDSGCVHYTTIACRLLDCESCLCSQYKDRTTIIPWCQSLTPSEIEHFHWLPSTCAYRLVAEGKRLPQWHPLRSGSPDSVHEAGISVRSRAVSEASIHPDDLKRYLEEPGPFLFQSKGTT